MVREPVSDVPRYRYRVDTRLYEINELFLPQRFVPKGSLAILPLGSCIREYLFSRSFSHPTTYLLSTYIVSIEI